MSRIKDNYENSRAGKFEAWYKDGYDPMDERMDIHALTEEDASDPAESVRNEVYISDSVFCFYTIILHIKINIVYPTNKFKPNQLFLFNIDICIFEHFSAPDSYVLNKHLLLFAPFLKELLINAQISVPFFLRYKKTYAHKRPVKSLKI